MRRYLLKRTFVSIITVIGIIIVVFFIVRILPGDPALVRAGPYASEKKIQDIRNKFGLNQPIIVQFYNYTLNIIKFEFGTSIRTGGNVTNELLERLPASLELGFYGVLFSLIVGIPLGFLGASTKDSFIDFKAVFVLTWPLEAYIEASNLMLKENYNTYNYEISDVGGEICNVIMGNVKPDFENKGFVFF